MVGVGSVLTDPGLFIPTRTPEILPRIERLVEHCLLLFTKRGSSKMKSRIYKEIIAIADTYPVECLFVIEGNRFMILSMYGPNGKIRNPDLSENAWGVAYPGLEQILRESIVEQHAANT